MRRYGYLEIQKCFGEPAAEDYVWIFFISVLYAVVWPVTLPVYFLNLNNRGQLGRILNSKGVFIFKPPEHKRQELKEKKQREIIDIQNERIRELERNVLGR